MKLILTVEVDGTEPQQYAHLDELTIVKDEAELVRIRTAGGEVPVFITSIKEA